MKTIEEIQDRLDQAIEEHSNVKDWHYKAWERYNQDKKDWGKEQADFGEVYQSGRELSQISREVSVLRWIISQ